MKTMNLLILTSAIALSSSAVFAHPLISSNNYISKVEARTVLTTPEPSKQDAYNAGLTELNNLKSMSERELDSTLHVWAYNSGNSNTHLGKQSYVTVQERMNQEGKMEYVGLVNVKVHYQLRDSNH